ncbi:MAG: hypothetical protein ACTTKO_06180 [Candidatus Limimorpha sp.]
MKRFTILLMAVVAVIAMAACGGTSKKDKSPKEIVKAYYQHMVDGDFEKALSYTNASEEEAKTYLEKMKSFKVKIKSFDIISETIDGDTAEVEVKYVSTSSLMEEESESQETIKLIKEEGCWVIDEK